MVGVAEAVIVAVAVGAIVNVPVGAGELLTSGNNDLPHAPIKLIHSDNAAIVGVTRRTRRSQQACVLSFWTEILIHHAFKASSADQTKFSIAGFRKYRELIAFAR
jgi:hypothetical protein